ncbi:MAG: hypothetical protein GAK30_02102 [Paracidovorax wautersii]|uniref:Uncharacterized protein n=1 Tax=Paracidovorax wautersii TaxID=1177982 RepID=A0A7V8FNM3_9BURK|nr:MAG: hypothetical protein GAK30_02102 [Paracidovorax wautersii]
MAAPSTTPGSTSGSSSRPPKMGLSGRPVRTMASAAGVPTANASTVATAVTFSDSSSPLTKAACANTALNQCSV